MFMLQHNHPVPGTNDLSSSSSKPDTTALFEDAYDMGFVNLNGGSEGHSNH